MKARVISAAIAAVLFLTMLVPASFAEIDYESTYETALNLARNDLANTDNLNDSVVMLEGIGSFGFSRSYLLYFEQLLAIQSEKPDLEQAQLILELCKDNADFCTDLEQRGFPSCSSVLSYIEAREYEKNGDLDSACAIYRKMSILDALDRAVALALKIADATPTPTPKITSTPEPTATPTPTPTATPMPTPGNTVAFGRYEQDNNTANGPEEIEWIVLEYDEKGHKALLLSRYGLDAVPYNKEYVSTTWEKCTLRAWLNGEFMKEAFTTEEQSAILITDVDNSSSQGYSEWDTDGGNNTRDQIFLLSYAEANRYLNVTYYDGSKNTGARVAPTAHAIAYGARASSNNQTADGKAAGWWWLRSPGNFRLDAARVLPGGSLGYSSVDSVGGVVRPAFWINLESGIF